MATTTLEFTPHKQSCGDAMARRQWWAAAWLLRVWMPTLAVMMVAPAHTAWAVDKTKAAAALGEQARVAFEAGQLDQAIRLYHEAYRADPKQLAWLYNAARVEHTAGKWDEAEKHYSQVLAAAAPEEPVAVSARERLAQLHAARAERLQAQQVANAQDAMREKQYLVAT